MNAFSMPMPHAASPDSLLTPYPCPFEQRSIAGIIEDVERRVRIMCRMMQLFRFDERPSGNAEDEISDLTMAMAVFYEYVDRQMDTLTALSEAVSKTGYVSLEKLRERSNG